MNELLALVAGFHRLSTPRVLGFGIDMVMTRGCGGRQEDHRRQHRGCIAAGISWRSKSIAPPQTHMGAFGRPFHFVISMSAITRQSQQSVAHQTDKRRTIYEAPPILVRKTTKQKRRYTMSKRMIVILLSGALACSAIATGAEAAGHAGGFGGGHFGGMGLGHIVQQQLAQPMTPQFNEPGPQYVPQVTNPLSQSTLPGGPSTPDALGIR